MNECISGHKDTNLGLQVHISNKGKDRVSRVICHVRMLNGGRADVVAELCNNTSSSGSLIPLPKRKGYFAYSFACSIGPYRACSKNYTKRSNKGDEYGVGSIFGKLIDDQDLVF